jgi:putative DNA primase/helicase
MSYGDAEDALRAEMAQYGLDPGTIVWDSVKIQRFTYPTGEKKNDRGWYKVHSDFPPAGTFGCHGVTPRSGIPWRYKDAKPENGVDMTELNKEFRKRKKKRTLELKKEWEKSAKRCKARYERTPVASVSHPYLIRKGITDPKNIHQDKNTLLIPMKSAEEEDTFLSLQTITPTGEKRFAAGTTVHAARTTIGIRAFKKRQILYITEGWATGWSINQATNDAVMVAFYKDNLEPVAVAMRKKYPRATIIIASDNDKWKEPGKNPGVTAAKKAAEAAECQLAIPHFDPKDSGKPTDYNDLHLLEGEKAVRIWLDPAKAGEAEIAHGDPEPPARDDNPVLELPIKRMEDWRDTAPFECLGYDHDTWYYITKGRGQIVGITTGSHRREQLTGLAPLGWWIQTFPSKTGPDWATAMDAMFRAGEVRGVYRPERLRGRGCWREDPTSPNVILHLGDRLLPPEAGASFMDPAAYRNERNHIYERRQRTEGPSMDRGLDLDEARVVLEAFTGLLWHEEASGLLLAGWTALAPLCGALKWRPHVWITGGTGSGKSTVLTDLIIPLLGGIYDEGGFNRFFEGLSTEAGIRQDLRADAMPVVYDEAERTDQKSDIRIQNILALARSASSSSGSHTAKGTTHGTAMTFEIKSMFCMASIGGSIRQEADKTRISLLQLRSSDSVGDQAKIDHWQNYSPILDKINVTTGRELMARSVRWLRDGRLAETLHTFRGAASSILGDTRSGDQYGTLYAGAWMFMADHPPNGMEAREVIGSEDLDGYIAEQVPEGKRALQVILQEREIVQTSSGPKKIAVGQLVDTSCGNVTGGVDPEAANSALKQIGLKVDMFNGAYYLLVATNSEWIKRVLSDTPYGDNIITALRTLKDVEPGPKVRFMAGMVSNTTKVPLAALQDD